MIQQYTVSRDDSIYECFPDITKTKSGKLICVFRESSHHGNLNGSRLVWTESPDNGKTWSEKKGLTERHDASYAYNCPRISCMEDGELIVICDKLNRIVQEDDLVDCEQHIFRSHDDGQTWFGPEILPFKGIVPDKYQMLSNGRHIFGIHERNPQTKKLAQYAYYSDDGGKTWTKAIVADDDRYELCEVSIVKPSPAFWSPSCVKIQDADIPVKKPFHMISVRLGRAFTIPISIAATVPSLPVAQTERI